MQLTEKDLPIKSECRGKLDSLLDRTDLVASTKEQIGGYDKLIDLIQTGVYDPPSKFMKPNIDKLKKERTDLYKEISDRKEEVLAALNEFLVCECNGKVLEIVEDRGAIPGEVLAIKGGKIIRCPNSNDVDGKAGDNPSKVEEYISGLPWDQKDYAEQYLKSIQMDDPFLQPSIGWRERIGVLNAEQIRQEVCKSYGYKWTLEWDAELGAHKERCEPDK